jgi:hypothetical protein
MARRRGHDERDRPPLIVILVVAALVLAFLARRLSGQAAALGF